MEDKLKEHLTGLELGNMFVLCGNSARTPTSPSIGVFAHQDHCMEVATGKFKEMPAGMGVTK